MQETKLDMKVFYGLAISGVRDQIDQFYAGLLLDRLDRTSRFIQDHQGLHLRKAYCFAKMKRTQEADLEFARFKELVSRKAMQK